MRFEPFDWYRAPSFYDIVFDPLADEEADFVAAALDEYGAPFRGKPRVLEPACGTGRVLEGLVRRGWRATGFDLSAGMVAHARRRLPEAQLSQQAMQSFVVRGRFHVVCNMVSTFKYLQSDDDALAHLERVADVLRPGGIFLLGLHVSDYDRETRTRERWLGERDGVHVVCNLQRWPPIRGTRSERARARLVVTEAGATRGYESCWTFRTYDLRQLLRLVRREPRWEHVATHGFDFAIDRPVNDADRLDRVLVLRRLPD